MPVDFWFGVCMCFLLLEVWRVRCFGVVWRGLVFGFVWLFFSFGWHEIYARQAGMLHKCCN